MPEFRVLFVSHDYEATVGWFTDVMGLTIDRSFPGGTIVAAADGLIEIFAPDSGWGDPGVGGAMLAWEVTDADAEHARLVANGATILSEPTVQPWGHKNFSVEGPDGWVITLFQVVEPE